MVDNSIDTAIAGCLSDNTTLFGTAVSHGKQNIYHQLFKSIRRDGTYALQNIVHERGLQLSDTLINELLGSVLIYVRWFGYAVGYIRCVILRAALRQLSRGFRGGIRLNAANNLRDNLRRETLRILSGKLLALVRNLLTAAAWRFDGPPLLEVGETPANAVHVHEASTVRHELLHLVRRERGTFGNGGIDFLITAFAAVGQVVQNSRNELVELGHYNLNMVG